MVAQSRLRTKLGLIAASGLFTLGCTCGEPGGIPRQGPAPSIAELASSARATNELGWRVYERIATEERPNVVYSPASTHVALAILEAGAGGETSQDLLAVLNEGRTGQGLERAASATLRRWLGSENEDEPSVEVRSRIFVDGSRLIRGGFASRLNERFGAGVEALDFRGDLQGSADEIATWMQQGHPAAPPPGIGGSTRLVAVTQLRFQSRWAHPFERSATSEQAFRRADGQEVRVPMMTLSAELPYAEVGGAVCVELPYADRRFGLLLVRPSSDAESSTLGPSAERLARWVEALGERSVELSVPRFAFGPQPHELSDTLAALGLARAFDRRRADFSRMLEGEEPLAIGSVMQSAEIDVDEEGTRAAATTVASVVVASAIPDAITVRFDRPFLFVLRDRDRGIALFIGRVGDPSRGGPS